MFAAGRFIAVAIVLSAANGSIAAAVPDMDRAIDVLFQQWNKPDVPGCAVGVAPGDSPELVRSYGSADLEHDVAISPATIFEAGSVSKQFTAASILLLAEDGKLGLADDVRKYLPELPDYGAPITIDNLLSHTSGLRDWSGVVTMAGWPRTTRVYTNADVLDIAARQRGLNFTPGTHYSYTNTGYNLLAIIVERVSHDTLAQFSRKRLFEPLGMSHTQWRDDFSRVVKGRAIAYTRSQGYRQLMPFEDAYGNGGLLTTVGDLLRWNEALTAGKLGKFVTSGLQRQATLQDGHPIAYARGLYVKSYHGEQEVSHSGATAGYHSWLGRYPQAHLSIAVLCNTDDANSDALGHAVADLYLPKEPPPILANLRPDQLAERAGLYISTWQQQPLRLELQGGVLRVSHGPALVPTSMSEFKAGPSTYRFIDNDRVVREGPDGEALEFRRTAPWQPQSPQLTQFVGRYRSDEALASYQVDVVDGRLVATLPERRDAALILSPIYADTFAPADRSHPLVHFSRDPKGSVRAFEIRDAPIYGLAFSRIPDTGRVAGTP